MQVNRYQIGQSVLTAVLIALLLLTFGPQNEAPTANAAEPQAGSTAAVPGGPGYVMVPATAFVAENSTDVYQVFWGDLSVPSSSPNPVVYFNAPVYLPQGATLTGLTVYYHDTTDDSKSLGLDMFRKQLPGWTSVENVGLSVYGNLLDWGLYQSDMSPEPTRALVDNSQYAYWLRLYIYAAPAYLQLQGVRVDYSFGAALPLIQR